MQKVQRWSQPCWTCRKARLLPSKPSTRWARGLRRDPRGEAAFGEVALRLAAWRDCRARGRPRAARHSARASSSAAQPVTMIRRLGMPRRARRIAWRAWRSASAVTAQVLTMTASLSPAAAAARRMTSRLERVEPAAEGDDLGLGHGCGQPAAEQARVERALEAQRRRPGHDHMPVLAPGDVELCRRRASTAALAPGEPAPMRGDERGAGAAAAGAGDPGAALPDAQPDVAAVADRGDPDIGALRKQRVMFEDRPERGEIDRLGIVDKERRVRVADIGADRRRQAGRAPDRRARCPSARASGISRQPVRAGPISTAIRPSGRASASSSPAMVSIRTRGSPVSRPSRSATQRVALPQASASLPSALWMRIRTWASGWRGGSSRITWSQPMPVRRSASARAAAASTAIAVRRPSSTTKSLPSPCILRNGILPIAAAYMAARVSCPTSRATRHLHDWSRP